MSYSGAKMTVGGRGQSRQNLLQSLLHEAQQIFWLLHHQVLTPLLLPPLSGKRRNFFGTLWTFVSRHQLTPLCECPQPYPPRQGQGETLWIHTSVHNIAEIADIYVDAHDNDDLDVDANEV